MMDIYYQWLQGSYSYIASLKVKKWLSKTNNIVGVQHFDEVRKHIENGDIGVLPIENSYAGSIYSNIHNFLRYDFSIIWELFLPIRHCLLSNAKKIQDVKKVYSHPQALAQCYQFLKSHKIESVERWDTAWAAKYIANTNDITLAAIASKECSKIYKLNILQEWIEDQKENTTRFVIVSKNKHTAYKRTSNKTSIIFETKHMVWALYKCLWCFATHAINLTKIESLPSHKNPFNYIFWIDFQGTTCDTEVKQALKELTFYANNIKIIGAYYTEPA